MSDKFHGNVKADRTSVSLPVLLIKAADSTELTGKVAADVTASYWRQGGVRVAITASDLAAVNSAYAAGGWKEVDASNEPGLYRLDVPDAALVAGADWVIVSVKVASAFVYHERLSLETKGSAEVDTKLGSPIGASVSADLVTIAAYVDTEVAAIKAKTDNLPASPAAVGSAMTLAAGAIATATFAGGATLPRVTLADTLTTYTGNTPQTGDAFARLGGPSGASIAADIAALLATTDIFDTGTVSASPSPTTTTFTATGSRLNATSAFYTTPKPMFVHFITGSLAGRSAKISVHAVSGSNHAFTLTAALTAAPAAGDTFAILGYSDS
jgi:hypothetical protein